MTARLASAAGPSPAAGARRRWAVPVLQAAVLAAVLLVDSSQVMAARADARAEQGFGQALAVAAPQRAISPPVALEVRALGVHTRLIGLRKDRRGALQVPADPKRAGWYSQGPAPGAAGPAVLVGHVDSYRGPGIFAGLAGLKAGDAITVRRADGSRVVFVVQQVQKYDKRHFPSAVVYRGDGRPSLRLITCGGEFDRRAGHYRSNVVVYAALKA